MKFLTADDIRNLSFPDTEVITFKLDLDKKLFEVNTIDAYVGETPGGREIQYVSLKISRFESVKIEEFKDNAAAQINFNPDFGLRDICEFIFEGRNVVLKGFSKARGYWTEYLFTGGKLTVSYNSLN